MAIRTTSGAVTELLGKDYDSRRTPSLTPFIAWANSVTDDVRACIIRRGGALTSAKAELIERWLAAHAYVMNDRTMASKTTGDSKAIYDGKTGMFLEASMYGQMALTLDSSGCLRAISAGRKPRVVWLGKPPSEQIDYDDRD